MTFVVLAIGLRTRQPFSYNTWSVEASVRIALADLTCGAAVVTACTGGSAAKTGFTVINREAIKNRAYFIETLTFLHLLLPHPFGKVGQQAPRPGPVSWWVTCNAR
jgi:hypothetical protein